MSNIVSTSTEPIDVEIFESHFPDGEFIALIKDDDFDEDVFEFFHPGKERTGWKEIFVAEGKPSYYAAQGDIFFLSPDNELHRTGDTAIKQLDDLIFIRVEEGIYPSEELEHKEENAPQLKP